MKLRSVIVVSALATTVAGIASLTAVMAPTPPPSPEAPPPPEKEEGSPLGAALLRLAVMGAHDPPAQEPTATDDPPIDLAAPSSPGEEAAFPEAHASGTGEAIDEISGDELLIQQVISEVYPRVARERFGAVLAREAFDPTWTDAVLTRADQLLLQSDELEGTEVAEVDCRQTLCHLRLQHRDVEAEKTFWDSPFVTDGPWSRHLLGGPLRESETSFESSIYFASDEGSLEFSDLRTAVLAATEQAVSEALGVSDATGAG